MRIYNFNQVSKIVYFILIIFGTTNYVVANVKNEKAMKKFELPVLPYSANGLAPVISEQTINLHHGKHLQTYINNLNNLIVGTEFENAELDEIVKKSSGALFNNAAQTWNHILYFNTFAPVSEAAKEPKGKLKSEIDKRFGSLDNFKKEFVDAGTSIFGSGWVWLVKDKDGKLSIVKKSNAENPITEGLVPLLAFDVWEHSYYLDYQNRRADHLNALWQIVDWNKVSDRY